MRLNFVELNVEDEILNGEPKYNVYNDAGELIFENVSINLSTEVLTQGTALNKLLFDRVDRVIEYMNSREIGEDFKAYINEGILPGYGTPVETIRLTGPSV